uniref:DUF4220 domain-containing protein n=1 Tax=Leersia perrieri TaxID=77586 RepID=A0A0D9VBV2_9ORYZ
MQSSPAKSQLYPIRAISLFFVAGCSNSITAYDLDDSKQWKKYLFELGQHEFMWKPGKFSLILECCYCPLAVITFTNLCRIIACWMATFSDPSKIVADYMKDQADSREEAQGYDTVRMKGYRYLVRWYGHFVNIHGANAPKYRIKLEEEDIITIDMIWEKCNDEMFSNSNVCLSFALFQLLKCRYFGINCYEADLSETYEFVTNGLLLSENGNGYARAFRIIEVELGFLYDFFFTKYASIYESEIFFFVMFILKIILTVILAISVKSLSIKTVSLIIPGEAAKIDTIITLVILGALIIVEILQIMLYLASDWALVSLACYHVRDVRCSGFMYSLLWKPIYILKKLRLFKYWQNKIGQYSVIEGSRWYKASPEVNKPKVNAFFFFIMMKIQMLINEIAWKILTCQYCRSIVQFVRLPETVKREIASSLKFTTTNGYLTSGEVSLQRNGMLSQFRRTLNSEDILETILVWHIATSYCEIMEDQTTEADVNSGHGDDELRKQYSEVATRLSKYSAYLMAFVPELLPGNPADTSFIVEKVKQEATVELYPGEENDTRGRAIVGRDKLKIILESSRSSSSSDQENNGSGTIFFKGLDLGDKLMVGIQDVVIRWKVLAEFWAEQMLYIAPSDNARGHIEQLANGGEFITHIWALLSHAGILTRRSNQQ